jgi:hypothetical protein
MVVLKKQKRGKLVRQASGLLRWRPRLVLGLVVVIALGWAGHYLWQRYVPEISQHPQYLLSEDRIVLPPAPPCVPADLRKQVLRDAGMVGQLSLLDSGSLLERIKNAFEFHPWVESVQSVRKSLPATIEVQLVYRTPVAAIETIDQQGVSLLPVDQAGVRLPESDLSEAERCYLPRISGALERPMIGQPWSDPRVLSGVRLACRLASVWQPLRLFEIVPLAPAEKKHLAAGTSFAILTQGGTRIFWGAAPGEEPSGESPFDTKLERLRNYVVQHNDLHTIDGPATLDVRSKLHIQPRTAKQKEAIMSARKTDDQSLPDMPPVVATKAEEAEAVR